MGRGVLALACLVLAACGGKEERSGSLTGATATTDLADRVRLAWTVEGDPPDRIHVERDGERIATLRGGARSFEDRGATAGSFAAPEVTAEAEVHAVHLEWGAVEALPGPDHVYTVIAVLGDGEMGRVQATGSRGPQVQEAWLVRRDGEEVAVLPAARRAYRDETAGTGQLGEPRDLAVTRVDGGLELEWTPGEPVPGREHGYEVAAAGPYGTGAASPPVTAARAAPEAEGIEILRDGGLLERVPSPATSYVDASAHPGRARAGGVVASPRVDSVMLLWETREEDGTEHAYRVRAYAGDELGPATEPVHERRIAPVVAQWRITRDGLEVAMLPPSMQAWEDFDADPPIVGPPVDLAATQGTRADGVLLTWESGSSVVLHQYEISAITAEGEGDRTGVVAGRALPSIGYEVMRSGGTWIPLGDVRSWLDVDAPPAVLRPMQAIAIEDRYRGFAQLGLVEPPSTRPDVAPVYTVRTVVSSQPGEQAVVAGYRGMDLDFQWRRHEGETTTLLAGAEVPEDFDPSPPLNAPVSWVLEAWSGGDLVAESAPSAPMVLSGFRSVSVSWGFACAVRALDDRGVCWGTTQESPSFLPQLPEVDRFSVVSAGRSHVCGLRLDGTIACRGGDVDANTEPSPAFEYTSLSSGHEHACAVRTHDQAAICWGKNELGRASPPGGLEFASVSAGFSHGCGVQTNGKVACWGAYGAEPPDEDFLSISAGREVTCGVTVAGALRCWGADETGIVGGAPTSGRFESVTVGKKHACAVRQVDRTPICWGRDLAGETVPDPTLAGVLEISAGELLTCAVAADERIRCWGAASPAPSREAFAQISAGVEHTCGIRRDDGRLRCWGYDPNARLPRLNTTEAYLTVSSGAGSACAIRAEDGGLTCWGGQEVGDFDPPTDPEGFSSVAVGEGFACAIRRADGKLICWGPQAPPAAPISPSATAYLDFAAGRADVCAIRTFDRAVDCWLGVGARGEEFTFPGPFETLSASSNGSALCALRSGTWTPACWSVRGGVVGFAIFDSLERIAVGANHACGIVRGSQGTLACGGSTGKGQIGNAALRTLGYDDVTAGKDFTCGIKRRDGTLICWGDNWYGQAPSPFAIP
ncbi:MAG TPA: RCC1 domain-containing protein [Vulgatibacter sp.]|nr:RCC1 domain-containing protein [Vulgatibacter sp.]